MKELTWHGCYGQQWGDFIHPEAFRHPAKFAPGLITRIIEHGLDAGWWARGDCIGDPFGGVGSGGLVAAYRGLRWLGIELEEKFVELAGKNFERHRGKLAALGMPMPAIATGDSRRFHEQIDLLGRLLSSVITSPPYAGMVNDRNGIDVSKLVPSGKHSQAFAVGYGKTPGQIGRMREGNVDAVVTSPPYADIAAGAGGLNHKPAKRQGQQSGRQKGASQSANQRYGHGIGQIAALREGSVDGVVTFGQQSGETYWEAMHAVYASAAQALRPGGVMAVVVKDYVKSRKRVPLCDDTMRLLVSLGFEPVARVRAMLVSEEKHADLFSGELVRQKSRKSFFRRLAEAKGSPPIDWEEVLVVRNGGLAR